MINNENLTIVKQKEDPIENMIYEVRGKQVMLVLDVARIYNSETKVINQVVKRNLKRFPEEYCFQLNEEEYHSLRSQIVTSKGQKNIGRGGNRYLPYVFTEYGVSMLATVFRITVAEEEIKSIWSQIGTKKIETRVEKYNKYYIFTEQGVAMLATDLRTNVAQEEPFIKNEPTYLGEFNYDK